MPNEPWGHVVYQTYCGFFGPQFEGRTQNWQTVTGLAERETTTETFYPILGSGESDQEDAQVQRPKKEIGPMLR